MALCFYKIKYRETTDFLSSS
jgi:hypothetical protein